MSSDGFIDHLPSHERRKWLEIKERSPHEYEKLRKEYQKGMREREKIAERMSSFAEIKLSLETDRQSAEKMRESVKDAIDRHGVEAVVGSVDAATRASLEAGRFSVVADTSNESVPRLRIAPRAGGEKGGSAIDAPSGNVAEALPVKPAMQDQLVAAFQIQGKKAA